MSLDADPVTPLPSAIKMSEGFGSESAVLLVQQGFVSNYLCNIQTTDSILIDSGIARK